MEEKSARFTMLSESTFPNNHNISALSILKAPETQPAHTQPLGEIGQDLLLI